MTNDESKRPKYKEFGWQSSLSLFSETEARQIRASLQRFVADASTEQVKAWDSSIPWLQREYREVIARDSATGKYTTILEYQLPRESRRPDVIVLQRENIVVVEIKGYSFYSQAALDQVFGYARDLAAYHSACAGKIVTPVLVVRNGPTPPKLIDGVHVTSPASLDGLLQDLSKHGGQLVAPEEFLIEDAYAPLPSIVRAARALFEHEPLPFIKRARASTDPALKYITDVAHTAATQKSRHLVLLSGVPGSGKTLVGLQLVHAGWLDDLAVEREGGKPTSPAVYLSGNAPLVQVLQHALRAAGGGGRTFVQNIKDYVEYHSRAGRRPAEHLIVFDEAQRAHDAERVAHVHDTKLGKSEPELLLDFCARIPEWCVLVALIGEGQAIHIGEEGGVPLWARAFADLVQKSDWNIHTSPNLIRHFDACGARTNAATVLSLDTEIRFHLTPRVHEYVAGVLDERPVADLVALGEALHRDGHRFLLCRDLSVCKRYLRERYDEFSEARYGVLASSRDKWLPEFGVDNTWDTTRRLLVGPWYNDPPNTIQSCCQLETVATEFSSQGLELDCAIVAWGSDLLWTVDRWSIEYSRKTKQPLRDPLALRKNVYRVLLTRGRDGSVVFVPPDSRFDATYEHLHKVGFAPLN